MRENIPGLQTGGLALLASDYSGGDSISD